MRCVFLIVGFQILPILIALSAELKVAPTAWLKTLETDDFFVRQFTPSDGLPSSCVQALLQSEDGNIWIGTRQGLARFNGSGFERMVGGNTKSLAGGSSGEVFGVFEGQLLQRTTFRFQPWPISPTARLGMLDRVHRAPGKQFVWGSSADALWRFAGDSAESIPFPPGGCICVLETSNGEVWVGSSTGLFRSDSTGGHFRPVQLDAAPLGRINWLVESRDGDVLCGGSAGIVFRIHGESVAQVKASFGRCGFLLSILEEADGAYWIGADSGVWKLAEGALRQVQGLDEAAVGAVNCLMLDTEGNHWLGSNSKGAFCLETKRIKLITTVDGLPSDDVWSMFQARDESLWVGTKGGASHLVNGRCSNYSVREGLRSPFVTGVLEDGSGTVWAVADVNMQSSGLHRLVDGRFEEISLPGCPWFKDVTGMCLDPEGTTWLTARTNLFKVPPGSKPEILWQAATPTSMMPFAARDGSVWVAGLSGRFHNGQFELLGKPPGSPRGISAAMYEDAGGAIWFASLDEGLFRYRDGTFRSVSEAQGLFDNLSLSLLSDNHGFLWMNSHKGVCRVAEADLNAVADGRRDSLQCVHYGLTDGMLNVESNGGNTPNACKSRDGRLWFPSVAGLLVFDPERCLGDERPPAVILTSIFADGQLIHGENPSSPIAQEAAPPPAHPVRPPAPGKGLRLPPGRGRELIIDYLSPSSPLAPETVRFKYWLEGRNDGWVDQGTRRSLVLTDLPPGSYRLHLKACSKRGVWSSREPDVSFVLQPFFYQRRLFYLPAIALAGLMGAGSLRYWMESQRFRMRASHLEVLSRERERISRDLHDEIGANLTRIALSSDVAGLAKKGAADEFQKISAIARNTVDCMRELIWATNPHDDALDNLAAYLREYAAQFAESAGLECEFAFPAQIEPRTLGSNFRRQVFLILKEALTNVAKHSNARRIHVALAVDRGNLRLSILDDGCGFNKSLGRTSGNGISNMEARSASIGGHLNAGPGSDSGTRITLVAPLPATAEK